MISKSPFLLSRKRNEEASDPIGPELDQLTAALQTGQQGIGQWRQLTTADVKFYGEGAMTWTVTDDDLSESAILQNNLAYMIIGSTLFVNLRICGFSIGGTVSTILHMTLPFNLVARRTFNAPCLIFDNTLITGTLGLIRILANTRAFDIYRYDGANFTASVNNSAVIAQIALEVQ